MTDFSALAPLYRDNFAMFALRFLQNSLGNRKIHWYWFHDYLCDQLMKVERGEIRRLIVNIQPRSLKSQICSIAFPAWILLRDASAHVFSVAYEESLAQTYSRGTRDIMRTDC